MPKYIAKKAKKPRGIAVEVIVSIPRAGEFIAKLTFPTMKFVDEVGWWANDNTIRADVADALTNLVRDKIKVKLRDPKKMKDLIETVRIQRERR